MSSCDVDVRFDPPEAGFEPGDEIRGTVRVTASEEVKAKALVIQQIWRAHGRGNTFEKVLEEHVEPLTGFSPHAPREFPFRFTVPVHPVTYHGHVINVDRPGRRWSCPRPARSVSTARATRSPGPPPSASTSRDGRTGCASTTC